MICQCLAFAIHSKVCFVPMKWAEYSSAYVAVPYRGRVLSMNRKGFTLIELLIVVVIIGILAAIAIPKFANTKEKAYLATMKSDLRNLIAAEEAYFGDNTAYTSALPASMYALSTGDVGPTIAVAASDYTAWVSNNNTSRTCAVFIGTTAFAPANKEGEPKCT